MDSQDDKILASVKRMNLAEADELRAKGFHLNEQGDIVQPENFLRKYWKKLASILKDSELPAERNQQNGDLSQLDDYLGKTESRRDFLLRMRRYGVVGAGLRAGFSQIDPKEIKAGLQREKEAPESEEPPSEMDQTFEEQKERIINVQVKEAIVNGKETVVFGDRLAFYEDAPDPNEPAEDLIPENNFQFYEKRKSEHLGFGKPSFFVLHTDGGKNMLGTLAALNEKKVHCQFTVGTIEDKPVSIQSAYLTPDKVNITGTTAGSPENSYDENMQFWSSLNVEIQGQPDQIDERLYDKIVELAMQVMPVYDFKISQVIGHLEVPNNGKPDPGRSVLKEARTRIYIELINAGQFHLIDVFPGDFDNLADKFAIGKSNEGPARINTEGRAKCWMQSEDDFVDWERVKKAIDAHPQFVEYTQSSPEKVVIEVKSQEVEAEEIWVGIPPTFGDWLRSSGRPLSEAKYDSYNVQSLIQFILHLLEFSPQGFKIGMPLPLSYSEITRLADVFIDIKPFDNRGDNLAEAIINICGKVSTDLQKDIKIIKDAYRNKFSQELNLDTDSI